MSMHWPLAPQGPRPVAQRHPPSQHDWSVGHVLPQAPQLAELFIVSTQLEPQRVSEPAQPDEHLPCEQTRPAPHTVPQAPQFWGSEATKPSMA